MAVVRRHFSMLVILGSGLTMGLVGLVWSDDPGGTDNVVGDPEVASATREVLGLGPADPLVAESDDPTHQAIIDAALAFSDDNSKTLEPVEAIYQAAREDLVYSITWEEDVEGAYVNLDESTAALADEAGQLAVDLKLELPSEDEAKADTALANLGLDPDLRLLELTEQQQTDILIAQMTRDAVTLNARNWHNETALTDADAAFEESLKSILDENQLAELEGYRAKLEERMLAMVALEAAALELPAETK